MAKKLVKKIIVGFIVLCVVFMFDYWLFAPKSIPKPKNNNQQTNTSVDQNLNQEEKLPKKENIDFPQGSSQEDNQTNSQEDNKEKDDQERQTPLKPQNNSFQLKVPFISQSPYKKWDHLHNEACEETSFIIAKHWLNSKALNKKIADKKIKESVAWQKENWGGHFNLGIEDSITLARQFFNIKKIYFTEIKSVDEIKYFLEQGKLVVVPMAGRELKNPYFQDPGPPYHMLVATGFNEKEIITNDPGTFKGKDFSYSDKNFFESIHDWPFSIEEKNNLEKEQRAKEILKGEKRIIIIEK